MLVKGIDIWKDNIVGVVVKDLGYGVKGERETARSSRVVARALASSLKVLPALDVVVCDTARGRRRMSTLVGLVGGEIGYGSSVHVDRVLRRLGCVVDVLVWVQYIGDVTDAGECLTHGVR